MESDTKFRANGWLTVLEKNGLGLAAEILENYGIDSETDFLVLDQDDSSKLASRGLKPLYGKKLDHWCEAVRERAENMLPSSLNTPAASVIHLESRNFRISPPKGGQGVYEENSDFSEKKTNRKPKNHKLYSLSLMCVYCQS